MSDFWKFINLHPVFSMLFIIILVGQVCGVLKKIFSFQCKCCKLFKLK